MLGTLVCASPDLQWSNTSICSVQSARIAAGWANRSWIRLLSRFTFSPGTHEVSLQHYNAMEKRAGRPRQLGGASRGRAAGGAPVPAAPVPAAAMKTTTVQHLLRMKMLRSTASCPSCCKSSAACKRHCSAAPRWRKRSRSSRNARRSSYLHALSGPTFSLRLNAVVVLMVAGAPTFFLLENCRGKRKQAQHS